MSGIIAFKSYGDSASSWKISLWIFTLTKLFNPVVNFTLHISSIIIIIIIIIGTSVYLSFLFLYQFVFLLYSGCYHLSLMVFNTVINVNKVCFLLPFTLHRICLVHFSSTLSLMTIILLSSSFPFIWNQSTSFWSVELFAKLFILIFFWTEASIIIFFSKFKMILIYSYVLSSVPAFPYS